MNKQIRQIAQTLIDGIHSWGNEEPFFVWGNVSNTEIIDLCEAVLNEPEDVETLYHFRAEIILYGDAISSIDGVVSFNGGFQRKEYITFKEEIRKKYNVDNKAEIIITSLSKL